MANILLNGVLLPLMATWFIPDAIRKGGFNSFLVFTRLLIVFMTTVLCYFESKGMTALVFGGLNCILVYLGGVTFIYCTADKK